MKDALSLETAEGFGDWRVFLPQRAHKDLRVYCKKNPRLYDITLKKLRYGVSYSRVLVAS